MNWYESMVILNSSLSEDEIKSSVEKISDVITKSSGEVYKADNWGRRKLAYELNKNKMGTYIFYLFRAPSATIGKMESLFKVFDPVLKFMVIRLGSKQIAALPKEVLGVVAPEVAEEPAAEVKPDVNV
jgi:small subunit ribosomal protein S6